MDFDKKQLYKNFPESPGVYIMENSSGDILYVGKAGNLKKRVSSYFYKSHNRRIESLIQEMFDIKYRKTDSTLEALVLEAALIKKHRPLYNIKEKDDRSFLYVEISDDELPQVRLVRGRMKSEGERFGPYTKASDLRNAMHILRKIFPYSVHKIEKYGKFNRSCLDAQIGLCPGTCDGSVDKEKYIKNIKGLKQILRGKKKSLVYDLEKQMKEEAHSENFEEAERLKRQIFALKHINDTALISDPIIASDEYKQRIEGYDISNISGTLAVGSMVVFYGGESFTKEYKKFKIKTIEKQNDVGMLGEVLDRRLYHDEWKLPELILVDGGKGQVNIMKSVLDNHGYSIPVVGIAKGVKRNKNEFFGDNFEGFDKDVLIKVRNEAHRFAIKYHKNLRNRKFLKSN